MQNLKSTCCTTPLFVT